MDSGTDAASNVNRATGPSTAVVSETPAAHARRNSARSLQELYTVAVAAALGFAAERTVSLNGDKTSFDFGEWHSEMASKKNPDGTISFITIAPGIMGLEFVVGAAPQRTLTLRDAQHEYVFQEAAK